MKAQTIDINEYYRDKDHLPLRISLEKLEVAVIALTIDINKYCRDIKAFTNKDTWQDKIREVILRPKAKE